MENISLELSITQINIILAGLAKLPLETSLETFTSVKQQADLQIQNSITESPLPDKVINNKGKNVT
jgi:hypothetical protein